MMTADQGSVLHDRATHGEKLTAHEQQLLDAWYREQDQAELALLAQGVLATMLPRFENSLKRQ